jgi:hypothetical protein
MRRLLLLAALLLAPAPAAGRERIQFTGYGSFLAIPYGRYEGGPAPAFPRDGEHFVNPGARLDAVGLFAATEVAEDTSFLLDLSFRGIGAASADTRLQYAYLDARLPWGGLRAQAGKIKLPFNYYSANRFYPFQRAGLAPPFAVANALGLPIADAGGALSRCFELGEAWRADLTLYGVNGYGHVPGSTGSLRSPAAPGGLGLHQNLGATNSNKDIAAGGQASVEHAAYGQAGLSYYRGAWDPEGRRLLQLAGAHLLLTPGELDLLIEYLYLHARGDEGMALSFGSPDWRTQGVFVTASHPVFTLRQVPVLGHARGENYASGRVGGGPGHEVLRSAAGGLTALVTDRVTLKTEYYWVRYALPVLGGSGISVEGRSLQSAVIVTF